MRAMLTFSSVIVGGGGGASLMLKLLESISGVFWGHATIERERMVFKLLTLSTFVDAQQVPILREVGSAGVPVTSLGSTVAFFAPLCR